MSEHSNITRVAEEVIEDKVDVDSGSNGEAQESDRPQSSSNVPVSSGCVLGQATNAGELV